MNEYARGMSFLFSAIAFIFTFGEAGATLRQGDPLTGHVIVVALVAIALAILSHGRKE